MEFCENKYNYIKIKSLPEKFYVHVKQAIVFLLKPPSATKFAEKKFFEEKNAFG